jgi:uncharacterized protein DUF4190
MSDFPPPGEHPALPPPAPPAPGWWRASDGNWYPPETAPGPPPGPPVGPPPGFGPPSGPPTAYGGAGYGYTPYATAGGYNGMAIASLVLGILWLYWIGSILALVCGYVALNQLKQRPQEGRGLAIAGIVLGWSGVAFLVLGLIGLAASR